MNLGKQAEDLAACFVEKNFGWSIIEKNWKTRNCEIDLIALENVKKRFGKDEQIVHIIEVKYRSSQLAGSALDSINRKKQQQLIYAAQQWQFSNNHYTQIQIDAIGLDGDIDNPKVDYQANCILDE